MLGRTSRGRVIIIKSLLISKLLKIIVAITFLLLLLGTAKAVAGIELEQRKTPAQKISEGWAKN